MYLVHADSATHVANGTASPRPRKTAAVRRQRCQARITVNSLPISHAPILPSPITRKYVPGQKKPQIPHSSARQTQNPYNKMAAVGASSDHIHGSLHTESNSVCARIASEIKAENSRTTNPASEMTPRHRASALVCSKTEIISLP